MPVRYSATAGLGGGGSVTCLGGVVACTAAGAPPQCDAVTAVLPDTALAEDAATCERPLFDVFTAVAAGQPDRLAVDDGVVRLTYAELRDRALALGAHIAGKVPVDGLAGVLVPPTTLYPIAWLACLAARRPFLPFDPHLPPARIQAIITEAGLAAAIVPNAASDLAASLPADLLRIPMMAEPAPEPANLLAGRPSAKRRSHTDRRRPGGYKTIRSKSYGKRERDQNARPCIFRLP